MEPPSNIVLQRMRSEVRTAQQSSVVSALAVELQRSELQVLRYMEATAELCRRGQTQLHHEVLEYVQSLHGSLIPLAFIHHRSLDETPLRLRVAFEAEDAGGVSQLAKVYVVENHWSMVLKRAAPLGETWQDSDFLLLTGSWSPSIVASSSSTGTAIAQIMAHCAHPDPLVDTLFTRKYVLNETDEGAANLKAERLNTSSLDNWTSLHWFCTAHKAHTVADKTFLLGKTTLTGVVNALMSVQTAQQVSRLGNALEHLVQHSLVVSPADGLSEEARIYRRNVLEQFVPDKKLAKKHSAVVLLAALLNGDWRNSAVVEHRCSGLACCTSRDETISKLKCALVALLKTLKPVKLCKDNWMEWRKPISLIGLLCFMHQLLPRAFSIAFPEGQASSRVHISVASKRRCS
eukprot:6429238-Amphidinium_carterae.1